MSSETSSVEAAVREKYGAVAASSLSNDHAGVQAVAEAFGYTADELASIPAEANMGLSCGNPTATAHLKPGEVVVANLAAGEAQHRTAMRGHVERRRRVRIDDRDGRPDVHSKLGRSRSAGGLDRRSLRTAPREPRLDLQVATPFGTGIELVHQGAPVASGSLARAESGTQGAVCPARRSP